MQLKVISTGSQGNAYLLYNEQEALLIEAGVNIKDIQKAIDFNPSKAVGCIVSHSHNDHSKSMKEVAKLGIDVHASIDTLKAADMLLNHRAFELKEKKVYHIGNFKVMPFSVKHDVPCFGFLIEHKECGKTLFITDTYYCKYVFDGLNNIIIEANYSKYIIDRRFGHKAEMMFLRDRILKSHFSIDNCVEMLKANDLSAVNNIILIHLSDSNSDEKLFEQMVLESVGKKAFAAVNGMELEFNKNAF